MATTPKPQDRKNAHNNNVQYAFSPFPLSLPTTLDSEVTKPHQAALFPEELSADTPSIARWATVQVQEVIARFMQEPADHYKSAPNGKWRADRTPMFYEKTQGRLRFILPNQASISPNPTVVSTLPPSFARAQKLKVLAPLRS